MNNKLLAVLSVIIFLIVGYFVYVVVVKDGGEKPYSTGTTEITGSVLGDEVKIYTDEGLGFTFEYPAKWTLSLCDKSFCNAIQQLRQEKILLTNDTVQILIDPLGRIGADSGSYTNSENLEINSISWKHAWMDGYHRYQAQEKISLLEDVTTNGVSSPVTFGKPYTLRGDFKLHIYHEKESNIQEATMVVEAILNSLKILE